MLTFELHVWKSRIERSAYDQYVERDETEESHKPVTEAWLLRRIEDLAADIKINRIFLVNYMLNGKVIVGHDVADAESWRFRFNLAYPTHLEFDER